MLSKICNFLMAGFRIQAENEARLRGFYRREYTTDTETEEKEGKKSALKSTAFSIKKRMLLWLYYIFFSLGFLLIFCQI